MGRFLERAENCLISLIVGIAILYMPITFIETFSERIKDKENLERILSEEKNIIGFEDKEIFGRFEGDPRSAGVRKVEDDSYEILLFKSRNRFTVRHELYHIYQGACDSKEFSDGTYYSLNNLFGFLLDEISADIYAAYGLELTSPKTL